MKYFDLFQLIKWDTLHEKLRKFIISRSNLLGVEICGTKYPATNLGPFFPRKSCLFLDNHKEYGTAMEYKEPVND